MKPQVKLLKIRNLGMFMEIQKRTNSPSLNIQLSKRSIFDAFLNMGDIVLKTIWTKYKQTHKSKEKSNCQCEDGLEIVLEW